jgi:branched-subunit amino acid transport protein AzlD
MVTINVLAAVGIMAAVTFFTRLFPFLFFARRDPPEIVRFIGRYIPPMVMVILVVYSLGEVNWLEKPHGIPEVLAILSVVVLHWLFKNPLVSIFGGTILYMVLVQTGIFL